MTAEELTEAEAEELACAESEAEAEAEFCMNFVSGGGLSSDWRQAYHQARRQSQMTEEEFFAELHAQYGEYGAE